MLAGTSPKALFPASPRAIFHQGRLVYSPFVRSRTLLRTMTTSATELRHKNPAIFVCDLQEKFRNAIYQFDHVVATTKKVLDFAKATSIPVYCTTQTVAKLGSTVPVVAEYLTAPAVDKTKFSMMVPDIANKLAPNSRVVLVGIESHICITQTALDLRDAGHIVYVLADGVSSCNRQEAVVALDRLRTEKGIVVTTSESWMYECLGDASHPSFKGLIGIVKGATSDTKSALETLVPMPKI